MPELTFSQAADSIAELLPRRRSPERAAFRVRLTTLIAITIPLFGLLVAPFFLWERGFSWVDLGLMLAMFFLTAIGITVGYHRLFTHRAFETSIVIEFILAVLGSMAVQGPIIKWVAMHRRHHRYSDRIEDPHTPYHRGRGVLGLLRGAWHAHIGWFFKPEAEDVTRYVLDLRNSPVLRAVDSLFPFWVLLGLAIPTVLGGTISGTWLGALTGMIWGGLVRIFVVHHVTWSVNSACHLWGRKTYRSRDQSRDNVVFGVLALGEGWHNTHHAFPTSARHGLRWWQLDVSYLVIRALALLSLAWHLQLPSKEAQRRERLNP